MPIWVIDFISGILLIVLALYLLHQVRKIRAMRPGVPIWMYLQWQVMALCIFAFSHGVGHILLRILTFTGNSEMVQAISPLTGGVNSLTFVIVGILFFLYKDIASASERYGTLAEAKKEIETSLIMLQESSVQMEKDAQEIISKNRELSVLNRIAMSVSKSLEMDRVLSAVIKHVKDFMDAQYLGIYLIENDTLVLKLSDGLPDTFLEKAGRRSLDEPWLKREVLTGRPFFAKERLEEHAGKIAPDIKAEGIQTWTAVPLMAKGNVIGVLTVGSSSYEGIDPGKLDTLATIGSYIGVVIENSLLYQELKQKVDDLEHFRKFAVGREMRIIELKEKLKGQ
jgi:putative methionine-R-sulfoxide reductase with GAF domain